MVLLFDRNILPKFVNMGWQLTWDEYHGNSTKRFNWFTNILKKILCFNFPL